MAGKKTKKKSASKPAAKSKTKKAPAKQAKKAAAKKAAPKKKPPAKKPASKPAPKKKSPPARKPPKEVERIEVVEAIEAAPVEVKPSLRVEILAMARQLYGDRSDDELLALDPNDIDAMDPSIFYDLLGEKYGVTGDPDNDYFSGFGGPIKKLIEFVESRWDGQTRNDTQMPPGDWLQEYVHPESSTDS